MPAKPCIICVCFAGKSSIAALLLGLYDPASGDITLDGTPLTQLDQGWLRRRIGSVAQEPALLSGTVRDIIRYAEPDACQVRLVAKPLWLFAWSVARYQALVGTIL